MPPTTAAQIKQAHSESLPSSEQRRSNLNNLQIRCSAQCGKVVPRGELMVCARCKEVRYCSQTCQKAHWRAGHKAECHPPGKARATSNLIMKFAERITAVSLLMDFLLCHAVFTLDLMNDPTNAERFAVHVQCCIESVDEERKGDRNAQVVLSVASISALPMDQLSESSKKIWVQALALHKKNPEPVRGVIALFLITEENPARGLLGRYIQTGPEVALGQVILDGLVEWVRSKPKMTYKEEDEADADIEMNPTELLNGFNNHIKLDTDNRMRLRANMRK